MRLDTSIRLEQQMKLSPRMIQAMEILQLPIMALQERIDAEMQSNPVLEMHEPQGPAELEGSPTQPEQDTSEQPLVVREGSGGGEDFQRLSEFEDEYAPWLARSDTPSTINHQGGQRDRKMDAMANAPAPGESLTEFLRQQWVFVDNPPEISQAGLLIINNIDDDGYLRSSIEELAAQTSPPTSPTIMQQALTAVQRLDPPGIAARDLKECLKLQLQAEAAAGNDVSLEMEIVNYYLRDIEANRLPHIAKRTGKSIDAIKTALANLGRLNPRPGLTVSPQAVPMITPDVVVELDDKGEIRVTMPDGSTPRLYISKSYRRMAKNSAIDRNARQFISRNIRSAQWLIGAIEQRRATIRHVTEEVFKVQREFLTTGPEALKPLPMADVANRVGVHVATVSRAVAGKYVQTPVGIFPLRMFFSGGKTTSQGQDVAWDAIRVKLKEIVDHEDKSNPLNDDQIVAEMTRQGIDIARRTVAKYRGLLDIPPARKRRQF